MHTEIVCASLLGGLPGPGLVADPLCGDDDKTWRESRTEQLHTCHCIHRTVYTTWEIQTLSLLRIFFDDRRSGYTHSSSSSDRTPAPSWSLSTGVRLFLDHTRQQFHTHTHSHTHTTEMYTHSLSVGNAAAVSTHPHALLKMRCKFRSSESALAVGALAVQVLLQTLWRVSKDIVPFYIYYIYTRMMVYGERLIALVSLHKVYVFSPCFS